MAGAWTTLSIKDGGGTSRTMRVWDESGAGTGPFSFGQMLADGSGTGSSPAVKAASTPPAAADPAMVVAVSPNNGLASKGFSVAFSTLTRPANTTAYSAGDSISDNATAGSVTALSATVSDTNDDPMFLSEILISSTDTGLAGKHIRAYLYNSDPTASTGVGAGDNAAFANKKAGYIGSMSGQMENGFSDGTVGRLVPQFPDQTSASGYIVTKPASGAKTLYIQFQTMDAFTPSANSTTIIATVRGWQARAN